MPANTPRGYPYPLPTEPVAEGAQAIRNLAEKIDAQSAVDLIAKKSLATDNFFSAIPQNYDSLRLVVRARSVLGVVYDTLGIRFNSDSGSTYFTSLIQTDVGQEWPKNYNDGPLTYGIGGSIPGASAAGAYFSSTEILIPDYKTTSGMNHGLHGTAYCLGTAGADQRVGIFGGSWASGAAITSIHLFCTPSGSAFAPNSRAWLYGIK
jgi:hypothetical protein